MKKIIALFFGILSIIILSSCLDKNKDFYDILAETKEKTIISITEETTAITSDGITMQSRRNTDVILEDNYYNSSIYFNKNSGYLHYYKNKFYYSFIDKFEPIDYSFNGIYEPVGIEYLFYEREYNFEDNIASKIFKLQEVNEFKNLLNNVCLDFNKTYNFSLVEPISVDILFNGNNIELITFDLSHSFNDFNRVIKTITFNSSDIEKIDYSNEIDSKISKDINTDYIVKTSETLDTYMLEMMYQYGDSIFIKSGNFDMLIDAGQYEDGVNVNKILQEHCTDDVLDVLVATHGHGDHVGGFNNKALDSINSINLIIDYGYSSTDKYCNIRDNFIINGSDYYTAYECVRSINGASKKYKISDDLSIEILDTGQYAKEDEILSSNANENDYSVVLLLTFKNSTYLYTGDISGDTGLFMDNLYKENIKDVTVYKAAHHGAVSHNTNTQEFLNYINPQICLISAAIVDSYNPHSPQNVDNSYQHPSNGFINRIYNVESIKKSKNVYFNGTMGTIHLMDNGIDLPNVFGLGTNKGYYINNVKITGEDNLKFSDTMFYKTL